MAKYNVPTQPTDRDLAANVVNDIWDLFGMLTRDQMLALKAYFESLTAQGILVFPRQASEPSAGQVVSVSPSEPFLTEDRLGAKASHPEATAALNQND